MAWQIHRLPRHPVVTAILPTLIEQQPIIMATLHNTILQKAPDYLELIRFDRPIGTYLLLWPAMWALWIAAEGPPDFKLLVIFIVGTFLMRSAGCVIND